MVARPLTVIQMLPELESGGVERGTLEIGAFLADQGHASYVISGGGQLVPELQASGSHHLTWPHVGEKSPRCLQYILPLRRLLQERRVDILHLRSRLPAWVGYLAWRSLPLNKRPKLVTTFHGFYSINQYSAIMTKGERVICVSHTIADHIQKHYRVPTTKLVVIHRGVDEKVFDPGVVSPERVAALRASWQLSKDTGPIIMLPGRITRLKGHDVFIKSLALIKALAWSAVCVGGVNEKSAYNKELKNNIAQWGLAERIKFVGHCADMPAAMMLSDVVVSATSTEPEAFGRIAIEAQAMTKPIIATTHGGSLETVIDGKTGWLVPPINARALADALKQALGDPEERRRRGHSGRRWVMKHFTIKKMCRETLRVYEDLTRVHS